MGSRGPHLERLRSGLFSRSRPLELREILSTPCVTRPVTRWEDPIAKYAKAKGFNWRERALDRDGWCNLEKEFVSQSW